MSFKDKIIKGAGELGVPLTEEQATLFESYYAELLKWNSKINLTAITNEDEAIVRHFLDSLTPLKYLFNCKTFLDLGAGGGFPGLPMMIARPDLKVTLVDAVEKKVKFMSHIIRTLNLEGAEAVHGRAEDSELISKLGTFDCVMSRAFTSVPEFLKYAKPYMVSDGSAVTLKTPSKELDEELSQLPQDWGVEIHKVSLPMSNRETSVCIFFQTASVF